MWGCFALLVAVYGGTHAACSQRACSRSGYQGRDYRRSKVSTVSSYESCRQAVLFLLIVLNFELCIALILIDCDIIRCVKLLAPSQDCRGISFQLAITQIVSSAKKKLKRFHFPRKKQPTIMQKSNKPAIIRLFKPATTYSRPVITPS